MLVASHAQLQPAQMHESSYSGSAAAAAYVSHKLPGNPRFPLKESFQEDIGWVDIKNIDL